MNENYKPVDVLVLTHNGEKYLHEQLHSIVAQLNDKDCIHISDDGSTDQTLAIIENLRKATNVNIQIHPGPCRGVIANFFSGIQYTTADYVLVADQDDIWLPNKLALFRSRMSYTDLPHLLFSDALVWEPETDHKEPFWQQQNINPARAGHLPSQLFRNCVQGASMAINRALINRLQQNNTDTSQIAMHDWWCALVACSFGKVEAIHEATLLYRQHGANQVGTNLNRTFAAKRQASEKILLQALTFGLHYKDEFGSNEKELFRALATAMSRGFIERCLFLIKFRPFRSNILKSVTLWASILLAPNQCQSI